ncbi:MAG TPA: hypothetical protein VFW98_10720 [Gemmatimonadaceae bacterium]|nr:hypothetical protein [Gemmatimonadaceae bacterium]
MPALLVGALDLALLTSTRIRLSPPLLVLAIAAAVGWYLALALILLVRRAPRAHAAPATSELGAEPPAVANLLVNHFAVTPAAEPATLLDLAARHVIDIDELEPGSYICRLRTSDDATLTPYEARVLALLRHRAVDGVVPAGALTTGTDASASRWRRAFNADVIKDAQQRGLCRDYWSKAILSLLSMWGLANLVILYAAVSAGTVDVSNDVPIMAVLFAVGAVVLGSVALAGRLARSHRQLPTSAGLQAASRWLGVQAYLQGDEVFPTLSPASVTMWSRYLAHGAALGVATAAVQALPMGAEDDRWAWSSWGGRWRQVRIDYPTWWPLGWGRSPASALFLGLVVAGGAVGVLYALARWQPAVFTLIPVRYWLWARRAAAGVAAVCVLVGIGGIWLLVRAVLDLWSRVPVTGLVLRLRKHATGGGGNSTDYRYYTGVDDGSAPRVRAWVVSAEQYAHLKEYQPVTATVTGNLRHVRSIIRAPVAASAGQPTSVAAPQPDQSVH